MIINQNKKWRVIMTMQELIRYFKIPCIKRHNKVFILNDRRFNDCLSGLTCEKPRLTRAKNPSIDRIVYIINNKKFIEV